MTIHAVRQKATRTRRSAERGDDRVLAAKLTVPDVPDWAVQRPRITKLIAQGVRGCPLTVVTGPDGAGKTMALALWAAADRGPVAWIALDEYDNEPEVFWPYVLAALRRAGVAVPRALSASVRKGVAEHVFFRRLASALATQSPPVTLVVDDFHFLTEPKVLAGLDFLLRNARSGLRLVVSSRAGPLLSLHRHRTAGELAEVRASDLAFSVAEAGLLMAQHGCTLSASLLECLVRRTEGWAAGLRLAAISMASRPDPDQFVKDLTAEDSALTGYLVDEVLNAQPPQARALLLGTSILEHINAEAARELTGSKQAGRVLAGLAHANAFVQPIGGGWYRYHNLFAEVLRLKLRLDSPDRVAPLHQRAARWCEANGRLTNAVRHAAQAGDWPLAARIVIDGLAFSEIIEAGGSESLADEFVTMPDNQAWAEPQPYLVSAMIALSAGQPESAAAALDAAHSILERLPADQEPAAWLAAAIIRVAVSRRTGDLTAVVKAAIRAEALVSKVSGDKLAQHPEIRAHVLSARGTAELWSGRLDEAIRILDSGMADTSTSGQVCERADCLGPLALAEALRGRLSRAAKLADQALAPDTGDGPPPQGQHPDPAALAALAWVHLERHELREARSRLKQVGAALKLGPDRLIGAVACLVAACAGLAEGHADVAAQFAARARSGWSVPGWLDQKLSLAESRAHLAADDIQAALSTAKRAGRDDSPEATVMLACAWVAAGDGDQARRTLTPVLAAHGEVPEQMRVQACLVDARLSYRDGDHARGRRALGCALRLAEHEQLRLPFALERGWIGPVLQRDAELAHAHRHLVMPAMPHVPIWAQLDVPDQATIPAVEPLTEREQQVLRHVSDMLSTAEIAGEMYITANTVKSHIKHICHKLAAAHRGEAVRRARELQLI